MLKIEIDENSGFCFGVTTAIKKAEEELQKGEKLYCLGDIVHNSIECDRLKRLGLITINHEDYELAKKKMKAARVVYIAGVGVNTHKFFDIDWCGETPDEYRENLGIPKKAKLIVSVGELNTNKNHQVVLRALALLNNENIHYAIAGNGNQAHALESLASELGLSNSFHLLGYRNDINKLYTVADICCLPSFREGLPVAVIEGLASGLPLVVANNRGTRDLCKNGMHGFLCTPSSPQEFAEAINTILENKNLCNKMKQANIEAAKKFDKDVINQELYKIYV